MSSDSGKKADPHTGLIRIEPGRRRTRPANQTIRPSGAPALPRRFLPRPRLEQFFDDGAPLTVVHGAQGYGKTAALVAWSIRIRSEGVHLLWIDGESKIVHDSRRAGNSTEPGLVNCLTRFADDAAAAHTPAVLIVDNAHHVDDEDLVRQLLKLVQTRTAVRIVIASRGGNLFEALAAGAVETLVVPGDALMFTVGETRALGGILGIPMSEARAATLRESVGGWVAALRIVAEQSRSGCPLATAAVELYVRTRIFRGIREKETLALMMRYSLVDEVDSLMIDYVEGAAHGASVVRRLGATGFFEREFRGDRTVYRIPSLVRAMLRVQLARTDPTAAQEAHRLFAEWLAIQGSPTDKIAAFGHAVDGGSWQLVSSIWRDFSSVLTHMTPGRTATILGKIPREILDGERGMKVAAQVVGALAGGVLEDEYGSMSAVRRYADASTRQLGNDQNNLALHDLYYLGTGHIVALRLNGQLPEAILFGKKIESQAWKRPEVDQPAGDQKGWFELQMGLTHTLLGDHRRAVFFYKRAWESAVRHGVHHVSANAAANLSLTYALLGERRHAEQWVTRKDDTITDDRWSHSLVGVGRPIAVALMRIDDLRLSDALDAFAEIDDGSGPLELWPFIVYARVQRVLHEERTIVGLADLDAATAEHPNLMVEGGFAYTLLSRAKADLFLASGDGRRATVILRAQPENPLLGVTRARFSLLSGDFVAAKAESLSAVARAECSTRDLMELSLINAVASLRLNEPNEAVAMIRSALELKEVTGALRLLRTIEADDLLSLMELAGRELSPAEWARLNSVPPVYPQSIELLQVSRRESEIVRALAQKLSNQAIAESQFVSLNTVKSQLREIYRKLGVASRAEAVTVAQSLGLLDPESAEWLGQTPDRDTE